MLASMYDASLDQFKPHSWSNLDIWPTTLIRYIGVVHKILFLFNRLERYWNEIYLQQKEKIL